MRGPKIIVFAYSELGHACLKFLLDRNENVACVYTHEDAQAETLWFPSVAKLAYSHSIPFRTPENLATAELNYIKSIAPDLIFSFYYRNMIPVSLLSVARLGAYNMHGSFLPKFRGRAPVNWAVLNGETKTGATLHVMVNKPDAGDIVDQEPVDIGLDDTSVEIQARVTKAAVTILARQIDNLKAGHAPRTPQDHTQATYFGRRQAEDGEIDWSWPALRIHNLVRAVTHPFPGAFGHLFGEKMLIWRTRLNPLSEDGLIVQCGNKEKMEILFLQQEGKPEISGKEFMKQLRLVGRKK